MINIKHLASIAIVSALITSPVFADEAAPESPSFHAYAFTGVKSGYICNGYLIYDKPALQSGAGVTYGGFDANVWNTWGLGNGERTHFAGAGVNEVDYEVSYTHKFDGLVLKGSLNSWTYPDTDKAFDDWMLHTVVAYEDWWIRPEVDLRWGLEGQQGVIGTFKLSKKFAFTDTLSLTVWDYIAYASKAWRERYGDDDAGFVDDQLAASLAWQASKNVSFSLGVEYDIIVADKLRKAIDRGEAPEADGKKQHLMFYVGASVFF